jgi:hypothetical protein
LLKRVSAARRMLFTDGTAWNTPMTRMFRNRAQAGRLLGRQSQAMQLPDTLFRTVGEHCDDFEPWLAIVVPEMSEAIERALANEYEHLFGRAATPALAPARHGREGLGRGRGRRVSA